MHPINLREEYKRFNREIFGGELPENVELKWSNARRYAGITAAHFNRSTGRCDKCTIRISRFLETSDHEYRETLIHEMIHVKIAFMGRKAWMHHAHGPLFRKEMERINRDHAPYTITVRDRQLRKINETHRKMQHGIVVRTRTGEAWLNLYHKKIDEKLFNLCCRRLKAFPDFRGASVYTFSGVYGHTGQFVVRRTERTLISGLQRPHDRSWFEELLRETEKDRELYSTLPASKGNSTR